MLKIYHRLPGPLRSVVANARGLYLRSWRYGPETERLVEEVRSREYWDLEKWKTWQEERLAYVLHRAVTRVPYYRSYWAERRRRSDRSSWKYLENWPILEKETLRENPVAFLADGCDIRKMFQEHTSGTTGKPLSLWWSRDTVKTWYAFLEARWRIWYGVSRNDRFAILGGQLVTPAAQKKPPFWVWNAAMSQLYMSAYHLSPEFIPYYLDALVRYRIRYLWGYTSSLYSLALEALKNEKKDIRMKVAIANAEPVFDYQRQIIEQAFHCPLRETYGMSEIVTAAGECQYGNLHLWPEVGYVEILEGESVLPNGCVGDFVCTGLLNVDMPLIRYRIGDRGSLSTEKSLCSCGRSLPILQEIFGRSDDVIFTPDGRSVGRMDPVFKAGLPIREAQIIQEALDVIVVKLVPDRAFQEKDEQGILERIRQRLGNDVNISIQKVDRIPRSANGKFRAVICKCHSVNVKKAQEAIDMLGNNEYKTN